MMKVLKVGVLLLVVVLALAVVTLRVIGLDPQELEGQELKAAHDITRPGLWLRGDVTTTPVTDWSFVNSLPQFGPNKNARVMIETRTRYFIPHSVTTAFWISDGQFYVPSHQGCSPGLSWDACLKVNQEYNSINETFPKNKFWTANVFRDPRVRMKIGGKIYEMTMILITNKEEAAKVLGRDPEVRTKDPDGQEHVTGYTHVFHVYQRSITEFGTVEPASLVGLPRH
jgi:hypothetical protein